MAKTHATPTSTSRWASRATASSSSAVTTTAQPSLFTDSFQNNAPIPQTRGELPDRDRITRSLGMRQQNQFPTEGQEERSRQLSFGNVDTFSDPAKRQQSFNLQEENKKKNTLGFFSTLLHGRADGLRARLKSKNNETHQPRRSSETARYLRIEGHARPGEVLEVFGTSGNPAETGRDHRRKKGNHHRGNYSRAHSSVR